MKDKGQEPLIDYNNAYDARVEKEMAERKRIRQEKAKHQNTINTCNKLIFFEAVTLFVLVVAFIVMLVK